MRILSKKVVIAPNTPVYDLTVANFENFVLYQGVTVHNSKDVSDALASVCHGLVNRLEMWGHYGVSPRDMLSVIKKTKEVEAKPITDGGAAVPDSFSQEVRDVYSELRRK